MGVQEKEWQQWSLLQRLDWSARDVIEHGIGIRGWVLSIAYMKLMSANFLFLVLLYLVPPEGGLTTTSGRWQAFSRYTIYINGLLAMGENDGPPLRWSGGVPGCFGLFCSARYRSTRGVLKEPLFRCLGYRRTALDVAVYVAFLAACLAAATSREIPLCLMVFICFCVGWFICFDYNAFLGVNGPTFYGVLICLCLPLNAGGRACAQFHIMVLWVGSGLAKLGPWFAGVNGTFVCASYWLTGLPWLSRLMYRGHDDLRPTRFAKFLSLFAALAECGAPILLLFSNVPVMVWLAIVVLVSMHVYIIALCVADLCLWNSFTALTAMYLFVGSGVHGFDYLGWASAPWPFRIFNFCQIALFVAGSVFPDWIDYTVAHRHWAGNWPTAIWLLRKSAVAKINSGIPIFGQPSWDPIPAEIKNRGWLGPVAPIAELGIYKALSYRMLSALNLKYLPVLIERALRKRAISDYHVLHTHNFCEMLYGRGSYAAPNRCENVIANLQETISFEEEELLCIWIGAFPALGKACKWGSARWKIIDASEGLMASGYLTVEMAETVACLPSACCSAKALLDDPT